jgi:hypothetical protein
MNLRQHLGILDTPVCEPSEELEVGGEASFARCGEQRVQVLDEAVRLLGCIGLAPTAFAVATAMPTGASATTAVYAPRPTT